MAVNKVQKSNGDVLIDISDTTATADKILSGYTAYAANGVKVTGTTTFSTIYSGASVPPSSLGVNGDIYIQS